MSFSSKYGPCLCGAPDCHRCFPENFKNGQYIGDDDGEDFEGVLNDEDFFEADEPHTRWVENDYDEHND